jgi:hypothetical protein
MPALPILKMLVHLSDRLDRLASELDRLASDKAHLPAFDLRDLERRTPAAFFKNRSPAFRDKRTKKFGVL